MKGETYLDICYGFISKGLVSKIIEFLKLGNGQYSKSQALSVTSETFLIYNSDGSNRRFEYGVLSG